MKYVVMECHPAYAVVLDQQGHFLRVANQHFEVGQTVTDVIPMQEVRHYTVQRSFLKTVAVLAACLCLVFLASWQLLTPYGTVRMQINPDVVVTVNRLNYVIDMIPLNNDGRALLHDYDPGLQKVDKVLDELADRAASLGYLTADGGIQITVESKNKDWQRSTQHRLLEELKDHLNGNVSVTPDPDPIPDDFDDDDYDDPDDPDDPDDNDDNDDEDEDDEDEDDCEDEDDEDEDEEDDCEDDDEED